MERVKRLCTNKDVPGYLSSVASGVASVLSAACVQTLSGEVPPFQLNAARYSTQVVMSFFIALYAKNSFKITAIKVPWVILLAILSILYNTFYFTSAEYLPLGNLNITFITGVSFTY